VEAKGSSMPGAWPSGRLGTASATSTSRTRDDSELEAESRQSPSTRLGGSASAPAHPAGCWLLCVEAKQTRSRGVSQGLRMEYEAKHLVG
jgi:hypothetical protein